MDLDTVLNSYAHRAFFKNRIIINSDAPTPNALRRAALRPESSGQTAPARRCENLHLESHRVGKDHLHHDIRPLIRTNAKRQI